MCQKACPGPRFSSVGECDRNQERRELEKLRHVFCMSALVSHDVSEATSGLLLISFPDVGLLRSCKNWEEGGRQDQERTDRTHQFSSQRDWSVRRRTEAPRDAGWLRVDKLAATAVTTGGSFEVLNQSTSCDVADYLEQVAQQVAISSACVRHEPWQARFPRTGSVEAHPKQGKRRG